MSTHCKCLSCEKITLLAQWGGGLSPCCGLQDAQREAWPPAPIRKVFEIIGSHDLSAYHEFCLAAVLLESATGMLLERLLRDLKNIYGQTPPISELTLDIYLNKHLTERFYNKISDITLDEFLSSKGYGEFLRGWEALAGIRNKIVSGTHTESTPCERKIIEGVRGSCLEVFAAVNNDVLRQKKEKAERTLKEEGRSIILVVDDEDVVRRHIVQAIERYGIKVFSAGIGRDAVELYRRHRPGCVFLDVSLPDIDGISVLKQIKEIDQDSNIYFITGYGGEAFSKQALEMGAKGTFSKPLDLRDIITAIKKEIST